MPGDSRSAVPGRLLAGRYRLDRALAVGGMAEVWQATDEVLTRPVAVKLLRAHLAGDRSFIERFRREALAAARLNHPTIVAIYDSCTDGDLEAIIMEFVEGETLRQLLDTGPLDPHVAVGVAAQIAEALDAAHRAGLVHRDIKPSNVLICAGDATAEGLVGVPRVRVTDFGIAKALAGSELAELTSLTQTGAIVGTAKYLAPEQVQGQPVDARTDIYALGVVLYECLSGRAPFAADTELATALQRLQHEPEPVGKGTAGVGAELEAVVSRAMARDPAARFGSAADLRAALLAADPGLPSASGPPTDPGQPGAELARFADSERSWIVASLAVTLVAAILIVVGVVFGRSDTGRDLVDRALVAVGARSTTSTTAAPPELLRITAADAFDPQGDNRTENNDRAPLAIDGDPATIWRTECYLNPFSKDGVGLILNLAGPAKLSRLEVDAGTGGWSADIYVADNHDLTLASWGQPVASHSTFEPQANAVFELSGATGSQVLVWITSIQGVPLDGCFGDKPSSRRLEIAEARLFGSAAPR